MLSLQKLHFFGPFFGPPHNRDLILEVKSEHPRRDGCVCRRGEAVDDFRLLTSESAMKFIQMPLDPNFDVTSWMLNCTGYVTTSPL